MAKINTTKTKKRSTKITRGKSRKTLDDMYYGPEPGKDYFEDHSINDYFNWYNYMWDKNKSLTVLVNYAKKFGYKNANKFKKMVVKNNLSYIIAGLENDVSFPAPKQAEEGETGNESVSYTHLRAHET